MLADMPLARPIPTSEPGVGMRGLQGYVANKMRGYSKKEGSGARGPSIVEP